MVLAGCVVKPLAERREAIVFRNRHGLKLFGILHRPADVPERKIGVIFLAPGVKSRVAPHRLYLKMTASLLRQGYVVLRFDFYGLGDSEGELAEKKLLDLYATVWDGRYVDDALCAMDWMEQSLGLKRFVLAGLCGGALTGLLAAAKDRRARGVLGLGLPVVLDGRTADASKFMTQGQLENVGDTYLRKLFNPAAWWRFLTFRTDYRMLGRWLHCRLRAGRSTQEAAGEIAAGSNLNPRFPPAFHQFVADGGKLLLVFSGGDRLTWEFEEKFAAPFAHRLHALGDRYEVHTIPNANHIFSDPAWRSQMQALSDDWMSRHF
jgi:alpha/beta superfamily hydrolase